MELNTVVIIQRAIELLVYYLILANLYGKDLPAALTRLYTTKQKRLPANIGLLIAYPLLIAVIFYFHREYAYAIDHILRPFAAFFLLR